MQRKVFSIILVLNMAAGFVLSTYASEQELPQAETSTEQDDQVIKNDSDESFAESEIDIVTELEEKENTDTEIEELEETATEVETMGKAETEIETELVEEVIETETSLTENTDIETEELDEFGTEIETIDKTETETEIDMETETTNESEIVEDSEITTETEIETESEKHTVYSVEFPSIDEFRFILDPYGLKGLTQGKSASLEELKSYAGKIYCNKKMMVTNKSSVPIKVKVSIQLTGDIIAKESREELESDSGNNVLMYIIPSNNDLEGELENYQQSDLGIVVKKDEPTVFELILPESQYQWNESIESNSMEYEIADGEKGHSAAFEIAGLINTRANWKKFDMTGKKIGLEISYSYEHVLDQPVADSQLYDAFGVLPYSGAVVKVD